MFKTLLQVAGIVFVGYIGFEVGRHWDEISAEMDDKDPPSPTEPTVVVDTPMNSAE